MTRIWNATGVTDMEFIKMDSDIKSQISTHINSFNVLPDRLSIDLFFTDLENAADMFNGGKKLAADSAPSKARRNLNAAIDAALKLNDCLDELDGNSLELIAEVRGGSAYRLQEIFQEKILCVLNEAGHKADEYPSKGRLSEDHRLFLAVDVAKAIQANLDVTPTTTKDGLYEGVLVILLGWLTGKQNSSANDLARKALKLLKSNN